MKTILQIIIKEFSQFRRDPKMFGITLVAPVIQLIFLGYAANMDVNVVHTLVYDQDRTEESREFIRRYESSGFFSMDHYAMREQEIVDQINSGKILIAIVIPKDFGKKINRNETTQIQFILNGSDGNTAGIAAGYAGTIAGGFSRLLMTEYLDKMGRKVAPAGQIDPEVRVWYNPLLKTRYYMVPAIVGLLLSLITMLLTSLAIVKEKEIGTLEQLIVTPIKPIQLIIGKLVPFIILGFIAVILVITAMHVIFSIDVRGSVSLLFVSSFLYILSALGLGLFVSTISKTQQQAMMIAIFGVLMPMVYLSGFAFPLENMPKIIQSISYLIPLRYFLTIIRGIVLKGVGFEVIWKEMLILLVMGAAILFLSSLRFRKRLE